MPFFALSLFSSALLLFLVQPMVGKMILPSLGGTPAVWNTCMVFFQVVLLAGYAYAHGSVTLLGVRRQAMVHVAVLLFALLALPICVSMDGVPTASNNPTWWLLGRLAVGVGVPFLVVSMNGPLLQRWFAATRHPSARDPYFLYGASNIGSLLGLFGYPLLMEPRAALENQSWIWAAGYVGLSGMVLGCALLMWRVPAESCCEAPAVDEEGMEGEAASITWVRRLRWIALAFVPSSLMLGATTHITSDLAPVPLLWVVPLALYLLTFVFVFARRPVLSHVRVMQVLPFVVVPLGLLTVARGGNTGWVVVFGHLLLMFLAGLACHGELVGDRPPARLLTGFYWWMSVGGALGGVFNALLAPFLFNSILEYPLAMVLLCIVFHRSSQLAKRWSRGLLDYVAPVGVGAATAALLSALSVGGEWNEHGRLILIVAVPAGLCLLFAGRPLRLGLSLGAAMLAISFGAESGKERLLLQTRNYFGVKRVCADQEETSHTLVHGGTTHGVQWTHAAGRHEPLAYFHRKGPAGDIFGVLDKRLGRHRVAIVGLGVGTLACYARSGDEFVFYEIDPSVAEIARDPAYFTYLDDCEGTVRIVLGDGRLALADSKDGSFDLLVLDAFSSDAIPTHLLTLEGIELYLRKLNRNGIIAFHISNRYLDLEPLLGAAAKELGLACLVRRDGQLSKMDLKASRMPAIYVVMARSSSLLHQFLGRGGWREPRQNAGMRAWTDDRTDILSVLNFR